MSDWNRIRRDVPVCLYQPALGQQVPGTCLRSTSSWDSWCCSTHRGCTHTGRPVRIRRAAYYHGSVSLKFYRHILGSCEILRMKCSLLLIISQSFNYQLLSVLNGLVILLLPLLTLILLLQVGLDGFVLCVEVAHILTGVQTRETTQHISTLCKWNIVFSTWVLHILLHSDLLWPKKCLLGGHSTYGHKIFDHIHVWQRVDFGRFARVGVNFVQTGQCVAPVYVHCTWATDTWRNKMLKYWTPLPCFRICASRLMLICSLPSRQERLNVSVGSISFLIFIRASRTIGPQLYQQQHVTIHYFSVCFFHF